MNIVRNIISFLEANVGSVQYAMPFIIVGLIILVVVLLIFLLVKYFTRKKKKKDWAEED